MNTSFGDTCFVCEQEGEEDRRESGKGEREEEPMSHDPLTG